MLEFREQTEAELQVQTGLPDWLSRQESFATLAEIPLREAANSYVDFQVPYLQLSEEEFLASLKMHQDWSRLPDFKQLGTFIRMGEVPDDSLRDQSSEPAPLHEALANARELGYRIPESFLKPRKPRRDKEEAFYAARDLRRSQIRFSDSERVVRKITSLTSGFLVPDPDEDWKVPFVLDQFWVIRERDARVRFIGVEIDNEFDLSEENLLKAIRRDEKIERQGIEVYHVAGWWCVVDPWRAMSTFIAQADIYPNANQYFHDHQIDSIDDYVCGICKEPMVRWDDTWIEEIQDEYDDRFVVHRACAEGF